MNRYWTMQEVPYYAPKFSFSSTKSNKKFAMGRLYHSFNNEMSHKEDGLMQKTIFLICN